MKKEHAELRRRPLLTPLWLTALAGLVVLVLASWFLLSMTTTTVIVVRHAEKELSTIDDPPLSQVGEQRAEVLARMFGNRDGAGRIAAVFASDTRRAQRTAEPLAARLGIAVKTLPAADVSGLLREIRTSYRGRNVFVVGHSNTVPEIVRRLSRDPTIPPMADSEYGTMYVVTIPTLGRAAVLRINY
ncbi:MAG TPA: phosphoglycerate mutase family protein [Steroidobacteraceae bacterium]|jgi:broad specificity phosphatase PhoE|nr:phosphoglycerate mutase family protein [Steroidobacteraceae bacterium]